MAKNCLVSVVIPTYNRARYLAEAIDSVIAQSYEDYEILVVDDGSTDDTREMTTGYGDKVRYIYQDNKGPSAARNNGIRNAKGELIAFLDSDDRWLPEKLAKQVGAFVGEPRCGLVATGHHVTNEKGYLINTTILNKREIDDLACICLYKNLFANSTVIARKDCFDKVGLFNENLTFAEDWEMWIRILAAFDVKYVPEALTRLRVHPVSICANYTVKNSADWRKVIDLHSRDTRTAKDLILRGKRLSWLFINEAYAYRDSNWRSTFSLLKSLAAWPFWMPRRYLGLIKMVRPNRRPPGG